MLTFRHDSEKPLRQAFQNLRGQIPRAGEALRPRIGGHSDRRVGQPEPQHRESFPEGDPRTIGRAFRATVPFRGGGRSR